MKIFVVTVVEISSGSSLAEAVKLLARHKLLGAPVVDEKAPEDASWIDRYIGIVEFAGIVVWILHQVCTKMFHYAASCSCNSLVRMRDVMTLQLLCCTHS